MAYDLNLKLTSYYQSVSYGPALLFNCECVVIHLTIHAAICITWTHLLIRPCSDGATYIYMVWGITRWLTLSFDTNSTTPTVYHHHVKCFRQPREAVGGGDVAPFNFNWPNHSSCPTVWKPFSKLQTPMVNTYCQLQRYTLPLKMCLFTPLQWKPIFCRVLPVTGHHVGLKGRLNFYWLKELPLIWHSSFSDVLGECETKRTKNQYSLVVKVS